MNIFTHPTRSAEINHPAWCHPLHCTADGARLDVHHSSAPQTWTAALDDVEVTARLHRDDERTADGRLYPHQQGIELGLLNTAGVDTISGAPIRAEVFLSVADAERLAVQLMDHVVEARAALGGDAA